MQQSFDKKLRHDVGRAIKEFSLVESKDKILVSLSGGKDSTTALYALTLMRRVAPISYELEALTIDSGLGETDYSQLEQFCNHLGVRLTIIKSRIGEIVFDIRKEKNPCSLCANLRRGMVYNYAQEYGFNKVALGHHKDDYIETLLINVIYAGKVKTFSPKTYLSRTNITLIRPLIYTSEDHISKLAKNLHFPIVINPCPMNGRSKREEIKDLIKSLTKDNPAVYKNLFAASLDALRFE